MTSRSGSGEKRSRPQSETSSSLAEGHKSTEDNPSRLESRTSLSSALNDNVQTPGVYAECAGQEQGKEETPGTGDQQQRMPSSSSSATHIGENKEPVITSIRATDVALGLRRVPSGFYTVVHHSDLEWRTENKPSSVNDDFVEWSKPIPIPLDLSTTVCLEVYASFEFRPILGAGEQLRRLAVTVEQLLDCSTRDLPFTLCPEDGDVVSPCSSILVTVKWQKCENSDSSASRALGPHWWTTECRGELEDATNQGHSALSRYRRHGGRRDLECSITEFERALSICPPDHPCCAVAQSNLAMAKFILCQVEDTDASLEVPLGLYRKALAARPVGHVDRPSTLMQLAAVHLARLEKRRDEADGARAEALLREAMEFSSTESHEKRAATFLLQLHAGRVVGHVQADGESSVVQGFTSRSIDEDPWILSVQLLHRFERLGDVADLQQAITLLEELVRSTSVWDDRYRGGLASLGAALSYRFERLGELSDLEDAISTLRVAVDLIPDGHPDKPACLTNLGNSFVTRFWHLGKLSDLEGAFSRHRDAVALTPHDHPDKPGRLSNLGNFFFTRFKRLGELNDLEDAVSTFRDAVDLTPHGHPDKPACLNNLGNSFKVRFERLGKLSDIEDAILALRDAVDLTPDGHPDPGHLNNLGNSFFTRFQRLGELSDLEDAISTHRDAVDLTPHGHPNKPRRLNNLGNSFRARFKRLGELSDLEDAISKFRVAVDLTPHGHPDKPGGLNNLGNCCRARFERLGELSDIEDAISTHRDAVDLTPHGHPNKPGRLSNLGNSFRARFERLGELSDLEDAISRFRVAVDLTPHGHPDKPGGLNNLATSFFTRFQRLGKLSDLEDAISTHRDAVDLTPDGHPDKPGRLNNLGNSFFTRFKRLGELSDLEDTISTLRVAVDLTPHGHPDKPGRLNNLGNSFGARFKRLGELSDLEDTTSRYRDAVNLTPHGHPDKPGRLNNLGTSFFTRFERLGELSDLEDAISRLKDAVDLTPHGHPDKPFRLNNLGNACTARFKRHGELSDLESAILVLRDAVGLTPHGHPDKPGRLNNLGTSFFTRFERLGELSDLEDAISKFRVAVDLTPHGHPDKPACLNNLGNSFNARFECLGEQSDLEDAISTLRNAVDLTPHGHPDKPGSLSDLGNSFRACFEHFGDLSNLEQAISLYWHAASAPIGPIRARFRASQKWISCARRICHHSLLHAYSTAINLLPELAWIGLSLTHRYDELSQGSNVVREAAAAALDSGLPETAVEWLEQGRSIVWGELFQLRSSYKELSSTHSDHARRLRELSAALEHASATREKSMSALLEQPPSAMHRVTESLQQEADSHRTLAIKRDKLLQEIRRFSGFEQFLLREEFSQLRASAHSGPVVILNAAESRCDALIVLADVDHAIHVPLPTFTYQRSAGLQKMLEKLLARVVRCDEREGEPAARGYVSWEPLLSNLWNGVVKPVLDALAFSIPGDLSRIFWCPTGPFVFLPIHAAGFYDTHHSRSGYNVSDFVISSYVPTLSILAPSSNSDVEINGNLRLLAVRQPPSDGLSRLPGVATELEHIRAAIRHSPSARTTLLESSVGTVEEVLALMKEADWVHFACHGIQDATSPTSSGLCLADRRRLKISDIIALSRPHGGLAFLSACETAMGEERLSDEAIHIAAGMLFAGYGGVIGTMWSISDKLAPDVARDVYEQLFRNGTRPDYREAARALHGAIERLRNRASFATWLPFIHVGL